MGGDSMSGERRKPGPPITTTFRRGFCASFLPLSLTLAGKDRLQTDG